MLCAIAPSPAATAPAFPDLANPSMGADGTVGKPLNYQIPATNNPSRYEAAGLPPGLRVNPTTGVVSGTPTAAGIYFATVSAANDAGSAKAEVDFVLIPPAGKPAVSNMSPRVIARTATSVTVQPALDRALLINPGKGFVEYWGPTTAYTHDLIGAEYSRCGWAGLEPEEGVYDWSWIDGQIAKFAPYGRKFAFGVINTDPKCTPDWVFKPGTNRKTGAVYPVGAASKMISDGYAVPVTWDEPVYLARMKAFIKALGEHCNGNPNIAFIDIRNYGRDGEGNGAFNPEIKDVTPECLKKDFFQPYLDAFPNTQLLLTGMDWLYHDVFVYAVSQGVGRRLDGICWTLWTTEQCLIAYPHEPVVLEYWSSWADTLKEGHGNPSTLMNFVKGARASYVQFQPEFYQANKEAFRLIANKVGYHFVLQQAEVPTTILPGVALPLKLKWLNDGVAPICVPCSLAVALLDSNNNVIEKQWLAASNPKGWMPDQVTTENFNITFSTAPAGSKLAVGLFVNQSDAHPTYRLGIQGRVNNNWYVLTGDSNNVAAKWAKPAGGSWQEAGNWGGNHTRSGVDVTVDFSTLDLTSDAAVTLDGPVTVGRLVCGDTAPSHNWIVNAAKDGAFTLWAGPGAPAPAVTVNNRTLTLNAGLTGTQGLVKTGAGTLVLAGKNSLLGNTVVNGGVLEIAPNSKLYSAWQGSRVTVTAGATLRVNGWGGYGDGGMGEVDAIPADDPKGLVLDGGTLEFAGAPGGRSSSNRAVGIGPGGGTLKNSSDAPWSLTTLGDGPQAVLTNDSRLTLAGVGTNSQVQKSVAGRGALIKTDGGTWTLTANNSYTGATTVSGGKLVLGGSTLTTSTVTISAGATLEVTGKLYSTGNLVNRGTLVLSGSAQLGARGTITNYGTILNNSPSLKLPAIINHGKITGGAAK
jgi:autotransporter-associated beta strand protein